LEDERKISKEEGQQLATELGCKFLEASAKRKINVDEMFTELVKEIMAYRRKQPQTATNNDAPRPIEKTKRRCALF